MALTGLPIQFKNADMFTSGTVLLHDNLSPNGRNLLFASPRRLLRAHTAAEARSVLAELAGAQDDGLWVAGYFAYELGYLFEDRLAGLLPERSATPLLWLGLYDAPQEIDAAAIAQALEKAPDGHARDVAPAISPDTYREAFERVAALILAGDTYQVNLTLRAHFRLEGHPLGLYRRLAASQPVSYGAYIHAGDHHVLSRSPELFVRADGDALFARPMKGTLKRGRTVAEDAAGRAALQADEKNRAENLMIVDLLRNDLGRIAQLGSVTVTDLFTVETYRSLHTMTSGIAARRRPGVDALTMLRNLFPCGSITGAPKLRAMEIIHEVESGARGLYTGAIGYIAPSGDFAFNVAIRTAVIDAHGQGEIGIGGGIVADSVCEAEYQEALLKLKFLSDPAPPVTLVETLKWTPEEKFALLDRHLDRLVESAIYFDLPADRAAIAASLAEAAARCTAPMLVRLTLDGNGVALDTQPARAAPERLGFVIADERVDSAAVWLAHSTTHRAFLDEPRERARDERGADEVVFLNEREELTQAASATIFLDIGGRTVTPPLACGVIPDTLRAELIAQGTVEERVLTVADLARATSIRLGNSVDGLIEADWLDRPAG